MGLARCPFAVLVVLVLCVANPAVSFSFTLDSVKNLFTARRAPSPPAFPSSFEVRGWVLMRTNKHMLAEQALMHGHRMFACTS
jgi:hypothetical protein